MRASLVAKLVKNPPAMQETPVDSWLRKILRRRTGYPFQYSWASLVAQLVKNPPAIQETWETIPQRRERLPTPVFWPGEFHGLYSPWGHKESDTTERLSFSLSSTNYKKGNLVACITSFLKKDKGMRTSVSSHL